MINYNRLITLLLLTGYFISGNCYFGWNFAPTSDLEVIYDGIMILCVIFVMKWSDE